MTAYIIVGAIATWILGWLWYQYLFPKVREELGGADAGQGKVFVLSALALLIFAAALGTFMRNRGVVDMADTLRLAFKTWLGFVLPVIVMTWAPTKKSVNVLVAGAGYWLIAAVILAILADWMIL
ncbi:MAG: hypothetical protein G01um1014106_681 [Parcubacteria group bacterium Gr01-1014_106]|nr:MAG: hypothetical protein G01um1014106_681 [Parcubacteria group bacterium Gr01-1014_106]